MKALCCVINFLLIFSFSIRAQQPLFRLLSSKETNIKFSNDLDETENLNVLSYEYFYNGAGIAVGDINNDGLEDIFFVSNMKGNKLFLNQGNLKFKNITGKALEGKPGGWKTGVTMADVNGDGLLDIYICYSGKISDDLRRNQLFINQGDLSFVEKAKEYGLDDPGYSTQAAFFDYDNDGDLDVFLLHHNVKKIDNMELARYFNETDELAGNKLLENDHGHFTDVSKKAGIKQNPLTFGLGIAIADINKDGWQDIYVTNDYNESDYLYLNNGNGTFSERAQQSLSHISHFSMGVDIADFNNDALPDLITLDMLPEDNRRQKLLQLQENYESFELMQSQGLHKQYMRNMLHLNNGDGSFSEIARVSGISATDWSWCPLLADFDNDGYKDLYVTNGYLRDYTNKDFLRYRGDYKLKKAIDREPALLMDLVTAMPSTRLADYVFRNNHDLTFSNKQKEWGITRPSVSSAAVYADLDNDGDLDMITNNINEEAFIYKNQSRELSNTTYLSVRLKGDNENTHAIGAKVYVYQNGQVQYEELNPNRGYLSCVSTVLHFGLGQANDKKKIDSVRIIWPDNRTQLLTDVPVNQALSADQRQSNGQRPKPPDKPAGLMTLSTPLIKYTHEPMPVNDFKRQLLMLFMYSNPGPVIAKGDVNNDGLEDLFISGDNTHSAKIYAQLPGGSFDSSNKSYIGDESVSTISAAVFFDANGDGFQDLYVARGGYSLWEPNTISLQDELYLNDGKGNFILGEKLLPDVSASAKSCVRPCDVDGDGDIDLFVGGRVVPGSYPVAPTSYLLINNGKGVFSIAQMPFSSIGMVSDAQWVDINEDGRQDLVLCGEFMPITIFINKPQGFADKTADYFEQPINGLWFSIQVVDVDGDGKKDIIAGNIGSNSSIQVSYKEPGELFYADFDGNGSVDPFFNFYIQGKSFPFVSRDELNEQIYPMRKRFSSYKNYSDATMKDIFTPEEFSKASRLYINEMRTVCLLNRNGKFVQQALPVQAQFSIVSKIIARDLNHDGKMDLLLLGNHSDNRLKIGSIDGNYGCLLEGDGKGGFSYIDQLAAGISIRGDVKSAEELIVDGKKIFLIGVSSGPLQFYKEN
ncbi:MAG: VCBS repeat-containing protein [Flavitalea sp.]